MMESELAALRADEAALRKELESGGAVFRGRACRCIFHDDRHPSAGIYLKDGVWKYKCQVCQFGGDVMDVKAKLNKRTIGEEFKAGAPSRLTERPPQIFPTLDAAARLFPDVRAIHRYERGGQLHVAVIRYWMSDKKRKGIAQAKPSPGGFILRTAEGPHPLYNHAALAAAQEIIVVEGEQKADDLNALGFSATTSLGGAGKAAHTDWAPLAGKRVVLWEDYDEPGSKHMDDVQKICCMLPTAPRLFRVAVAALDLEAGGDATDFIAARDGMELEELQNAIAQVLSDAGPVGIIADYFQYMDIGIAGGRVPYAMPWPILSAASRALIPGTVTALCGDPGCGKSLMVMQAMVEWNELDYPACIYEMEDGRNYHLARGHAQMAREARLVDSEWLRANPDEARRLRMENYEHLESLGRRIWEPPTHETPTMQMIRDWLDERGRAGYKLLLVDPVTAARPEPKPWISDHDLMTTAKRVAEQHSCCVVLIVHPSKGHKGGGGLGEVSGGAAFTRLAHTVIWLDNFDGNPNECTLVDHWGVRIPNFPHFNRVARVVKSRNGNGRGAKVAMRLDGKSLNMREIGSIYES